MSVPDWLQGGSDVALALFSGAQLLRMRSAASWPDLVEDLSRLDAATVGRVLYEHPEIAEIVMTAWQAAAQTANDDKRWLLAKVAATAVRDFDANVEVDELPFITKTVEALDPPHIQLLVLIDRLCRRHGADPFDPIDVDALTRAWPGAGYLVTPMLAALEREGLVQRIEQPSWAGNMLPSSWRPTEYGYVFLAFLGEDRRRFGV